MVISLYSALQNALFGDKGNVRVPKTNLDCFARGFEMLRPFSMFLGDSERPGHALSNETKIMKIG